MPANRPDVDRVSWGWTLRTQISISGSETCLITMKWADIILPSKFSEQIICKYYQNNTVRWVSTTSSGARSQFKHLMAKLRLHSCLTWDDASSWEIIKEPLHFRVAVNWGGSHPLQSQEEKKPTHLLASDFWANVLGYFQLCHYWTLSFHNVLLCLLKQKATVSPALQLLCCTSSLRIKDGWARPSINHVQQPTPAT